MRLRGVAVAELEQAAESLTTLHLACFDHRRLWRDEFVAELLSRTFAPRPIAIRTPISRVRWLTV